MVYKRKRNYIIIIVLLLFISCTQSNRNKGVTSASNSNYISVNELEKTLPKNDPINVGFDIDDTIIFSSPGFYYATTNKDGKNNENIFGKNPISNPQFWDKMNTEFDKFSMPKTTVGEIIKIHKKRGDSITFITARTQSSKKYADKAYVKKILKYYFNIENPVIIYTNGELKKKYIEDYNLEIYYGDADSDIEQTLKADARPIRVLRARNSESPDSYNVGKYGEEILLDSDF